MRLLLLSLLILAAPVAADNYTRPCEAPYTPALHNREGSIVEQLYPDMTPDEQWFVAREIEFLNPDSPETLTVPVYQHSDKFFAGDLRNWMVAVMKGCKYRVSPALMIAVRSHENPKRSRDWYAYGVKHLRRTNLWTQADGAARIIARISAAQGWSALSPTRANLYSLGAVYCVGRSPSRLSANGRARTRLWRRNVWTMMQRATP